LDDHLWAITLLFIAYLLFAVAEAAAQLFNKHKAQIALDGMRERSSINRFLLPQSVGSLRSILNLGKMLLLVALSITIALLYQRSILLVAVFGATVFISTLYLPFAIAFSNPRRVLRLLIPLLRYCNIILMPIIIPRDHLFNLFRELSRKPGNGGDDPDEAQQLEAYIGEAQEEGIFEPDEAQMVRQVVEFSDTVVKEVMTPRVNMECIERVTNLEEFATIASNLKFSRYPVIDGKIDNVIGIIHIKSALGYTSDARAEMTVEDLMAAPYFVPESKKVSNLLRDFQANKQQMAIVVDEYGGTAGIITLEDILEEIVGEIEDEHDNEEEGEEIISNPDGSLSVSGNVDVSEIEKILDVELDDKAYETVSGFALSHLKHIPKPGESFLAPGGVEVEIIDANERSINRIKLTKTETDE
jgi:CBS domain containing-hemolysin-like protein